MFPAFSNFFGLNWESLLLQPNFIIGALAVLAVLFAVILLFLIRAILQTSGYIASAFQKTVIAVLVPKEAADLAEKEATIDELRNQIAIAEGWLSTFGGLRAQRGLKPWFFGRSDHFSLEIICQQGEISFYVSVPHYLKDNMEQQILAQYPEAHLEEVQDYNIFSPQGEISAGYLKFTRAYIFPIKTYKTLNSDPLNAVTNSLSKIDKQDGVAIQIICRSAKKQWHKKGSQVAVDMQKGKTLEAAMAKGGLNFSAIFDLFRAKTAEQAQQEKNKPQRTLSPMEQELVKGLEEKTSKAGLDCNVRIVASAKTKAKADSYLDNVVSSFSQFNFYQYGNSFKFFPDSSVKMINDFIYRHYRERQKAILNVEELTSLYHFPTPFLDTPNIKWLLAKKLPAPGNLPQAGLLLGENFYRGIKTDIYLQPDDRRRHMYIIGMTGTGKSVLMSNLAIQDIKNGQGVCVIDPHGSLVEDILPQIPKERAEDVIYFNPADIDRPIGLNMLEAQTPEQQDFAIQEMIAIFYKLVTDPSMIGPMFEHNMRNAMLTLMADTEHPGTIAEIPRIFTDKEFQKYKLSKVTDPMVRSFWEQEMAKTSDFHKSEMLGYLISKVGRFIENAMIRNIIGQPKSGFSFREAMDQKKILLVNLAKGTTGEVNSNLLGLIIVAKLQMAALTRTDIPEEQRHDFYLYIDEFQNFITERVATILAEARKYKLNLILAHQYIGQLTEGSGPEGKSYGSKIKDAIFGNVGTMVSFRIGPEDAELIAKQMAPVVSEYDLINIERFNAYIRPLIDNQPLKAFNLKTLAPVKGDLAAASAIKELSRQKYGQDRKAVEAVIVEQAQLGLNKASEIQPPAERSL